jgi:ATP-dependent Clp protease ATP-binding subunit ClpA
MKQNRGSQNMDILQYTVFSFMLSLTVGARPLNRLIQKVILEPLAMELISGCVRPNEEVKIRVERDNLIVKRNHEPKEDPNDLTPVDM